MYTELKVKSKSLEHAMEIIDFKKEKMKLLSKLKIKNIVKLERPMSLFR